MGRELIQFDPELEALYARTDITTGEKLRLRDEVYSRARRTFTESVRPRLQVSTYASIAREPLNNATLMSRRLYYHRLDLFERVHAATGGDLRATITG